MVGTAWRSAYLRVKRGGEEREDIVMTAVCLSEGKWERGNIFVNLTTRGSSVVKSVCECV